MTIVDWIFIGIAAVLAIATIVMVGMAINLMYKMCAAGPDKAETPELKAPNSKGLRIGIYVAEKDRLEQANILARRLCATHLAFDSPTAQLTKVIETYSGCIYDFSDDVRIETVVARESGRGRRFNYLYIDKAISDNLIQQILLPQIMLNDDVSVKIINDGWEFFDANNAEQHKKEWRNGEWN